MHIVMYKGNEQCIIRFKGMIEYFDHEYYSTFDFKDYHVFQKEVL